MPRQIQYSQKDFSGGEIDVSNKRADDNPTRKAACRQLSNFRILSSGSVQNRSGRAARFPANVIGRSEEVIMSPGNIFTLCFGFASGSGVLAVVDATGVTIINFAAMPWTLATVNQIVIAQFGLNVYITFPGMQPQVLSWDGVSVWSIAPFTETLNGTQKRAFFFRVAPPGIVMAVSAQSGAVSLTLDQAYFQAGHVGKLVRFCGRQILITAVSDGQHASGTVQEILPGSQSISFGATVDPSKLYSIGDVVEGSTSGAQGFVSVVNPGLGSNIGVQLLNNVTSTVTTFGRLPSGFFGQQQQTFAFVVGETVVGPAGSAAATAAAAVGNPDPVPVWDEQIMDSFHGWPASCFVDQQRLGFCDFPAVPNGIGWSAIGSPTDLYVGANPGNAMFEIVPNKSRVLFVLAGPESSEFVFCDNGVYYIPISVTNPLRPGSVAFNLLTRDGSARLQPRILQDVILFLNAGLTSVMAITAPGAFARPYQVKNITTLHSHLIKSPVAIAVPSTSSQFDERYAYVLNSDGTIAVGSYQTENGDIKGVVGWVPFNGAGVVQWVSALGSDVMFTTQYFGVVTIVELLDDTSYLDSAVSVNSPLPAFVPPMGKGPLWFLVNKTITLIDQSTRMMGTYQVDINGFIIPQFNGGEDLTSVGLMAGQPWTAVLEPFAPDAVSGADMHQRMMRRRISNFAVYVINSTGFMLAKLFSSKQTTTSPALGTVMNTRRVPAWNMGDDATKPPTLRETVEEWRPSGLSYDPRIAIIKDTPGPLIIAEVGMEISI